MAVDCMLRRGNRAQAGIQRLHDQALVGAERSRVGIRLGLYVLSKPDDDTGTSRRESLHSDSGCPFDNRLKSGFGCGNLIPLMSLAELKDNVMALPESERHDFVVWLNRLEQDYGDIPGEALAEMAAEVWDQDDRHAPPTHPAR